MIPKLHLILKPSYQIREKKISILYSFRVVSSRFSEMNEKFWASQPND